MDNQLDDYNAILDMDVLTEGKSDNEAQLFPREEGAITKQTKTKLFSFNNIHTHKTVI